MSDTFSTRTHRACAQPQLVVGFPTTGCGLNTVTLANGAVVDLTVLGHIISQFCPGVSPVVSPATAVCLSSAPGLAHIVTAGVTAAAPIITAAAQQPPIDPQLTAMLGTVI